MATTNELLSDAETEWARVLEHRAREAISGTVTLISPEDARRYVVEHLERLRREVHGTCDADRDRE